MPEKSVHISYPNCLSCGCFIDWEKYWRGHAILKDEGSQQCEIVSIVEKPKLEKYYYIWKVVPSTTHGQNMYKFHRQCWTDLMSRFGSKQPDLQSLFRACQAVPKLCTLPSVHTSDPTPEVPRTLDMALSSLRQTRIPAVSTLLQTDACQSPTDVFNRLPYELRMAIAMSLDTQDYFNLCMASRSMYPIRSSQSFWMTRFLPGRERAFLEYHPQRLPKAQRDVDWRGLYYVTREQCAYEEVTATLMKRWETNRWLRDACEYRAWGNHTKDVSSQRFAATTFLSTTYAYLVCLPRTLTFMTIFVYREGERRWICGIELEHSDRPTIILGYRSPERYTVSNDPPIRRLDFVFNWQKEGGGIRSIRVCKTDPPPLWRGVETVRQIKCIEVTDECFTLGLMFDNHKMIGVNGQSYNLLTLGNPTYNWGYRFGSAVYKRLFPWVRDERQSLTFLIPMGLGLGLYELLDRTFSKSFHHPARPFGEKTWIHQPWRDLL